MTIFEIANGELPGRLNLAKFSLIFKQKIANLVRKKIANLVRKKIANGWLPGLGITLREFQHQSLQELPGQKNPPLGKTQH